MSRQPVGSRCTDAWAGIPDEQIGIALLIDGNITRAEIYAWEIVEEAVECHRSGYAMTSLGANTQIKCTERLEKIVQILKDYSIIRKEMFTHTLDVQGLTAHPIAYASQKQRNLWGNGARPRVETKKKKHTPPRFFDVKGAMLLTHFTTAQFDHRSLQRQDVRTGARILLTGNKRSSPAHARLGRGPGGRRRAAGEGEPEVEG